MSRLTLILLATLFAGSAIAQDAKTFPIPPVDNGQVDFTVPSNNIECLYTPPGGTPTYTPPKNEAELSCDRAQPVYMHFGIGAHGPAVAIKNPGEQPCCSAVTVLPYGSTWRVAPFTCSSATQGLTCKRDDGRGFFISKERVATF
jgi:hypothetical protein